MKKLILLFIAQINISFAAELPEEIFTAACQNKKSIIEKYLNDGGNVDAKFHGQSLLHPAAYLGHLDLVKYLILKKADVNLVTDATELSPLIMAAQENKIRCIEFLLDNNADIEYECYKGTALIYAARKHKVKAVKVLLNRGANIMAKSNDKTAFDIALEEYDYWNKQYLKEKNRVWLETAIKFKIIAKLLFDKFIEQNCNNFPLSNKNLLKLINSYNLDLTKEEMITNS